MKALRAGLADGTIDVIVSDHTPLDTEHKKCEFESAAYGMLGLDTFWPLLNTHIAPAIGLDVVIPAITSAPRNILQLQPVSVESGNKANLTLFDTRIEYVFAKENIYSKSSNTPFIGSQVKGKAVAVVHDGKYHPIA
jgi:dihydroorotase